MFAHKCRIFYLTSRWKGHRLRILQCFKVIDFIYLQKRIHYWEFQRDLWKQQSTKSFIKNFIRFDEDFQLFSTFNCVIIVYRWKSASAGETAQFAISLNRKFYRGLIWFIGFYCMKSLFDMCFLWAPWTVTYIIWDIHLFAYWSRRKFLCTAKEDFRFFSCAFWFLLLLSAFFLHLRYNFGFASSLGWIYPPFFDDGSNFFYSSSKSPNYAIWRKLYL